MPHSGGQVALRRVAFLKQLVNLSLSRKLRGARRSPRVFSTMSGRGNTPATLRTRPRRLSASSNRSSRTSRLLEALCSMRSAGQTARWFRQPLQDGVISADLACIYMCHKKPDWPG